MPIKLKLDPDERAPAGVASRRAFGSRPAVPIGPARRRGGRGKLPPGWKTISRYAIERDPVRVVRVGFGDETRYHLFVRGHEREHPWGYGRPTDYRPTRWQFTNWRAAVRFAETLIATGEAPAYREPPVPRCLEEAARRSAEEKAAADAAPAEEGDRSHGGDGCARPEPAAGGSRQGELALGGDAAQEPT